MRTIVHLSDVHMGRIDAALVPVLAQAIRAIAPRLVVLSGDLTQRARESQFREARRFIDALPQPLLVIPGNHDVPLWNVVARFAAPLRRYTRHITADLSPVFEDDEMIVLGVNTARSWTWGEGRINQGQVDALVRRLAMAPRTKLRIIVTHHPFDLPPGVREKRLLGRAEMAMAELASAGADLFLSGHLHISHITRSAERYRIAGHSALIVQAGTVSMRGRGEQPSFNVLHVDPASIAINRYAWDPATSRFVETAVGKYERGTNGEWTGQIGRLY